MSVAAEAAKERRLRARLARVDLKLARLRRRQRSADTREKWRLGGLCPAWHELAESEQMQRVGPLRLLLGDQPPARAQTGVDAVPDDPLTTAESASAWRDADERRRANRQRIIAGAVLLREGFGDVEDAALRAAIERVDRELAGVELARPGSAGRGTEDVDDVGERVEIPSVVDRD